jgi:transcriptional regulator with XRE-family HTH domain
VTYQWVSGSRYIVVTMTRIDAPEMSAMAARPKVLRREKRMSNPVQENVFRLQLNRLIDDYPMKLTNSFIVGRLAERGCVISAPYLSQLRTGVRTNPSAEVVGALADLFTVPTEYFFTDSDPKKTGEARDRDASLVERISDPGIRSLLSLACDLSDDAQGLLVGLAVKLRASDQLAVVPPDAHEYVLQAPPHPTRERETAS